MTDTHAESSRIGTREKASYGMGDFANNLLFAPISYYLVYFYTDVAGIAVAAVGSIMGIVRVLDALSSPFVGMLIDRTDSRWGKTRPYIMFTALPLALLMLCCFLVPDLPGTQKQVYAFCTYCLFSLVYSLSNIAYTTLISLITPQNKARTALTAVRLACLSVGSLIASGLLLPLVSLLGKGDERRGFVLVAALFAAVSAGLLVNCGAGTRERVCTPKSDGSFFGSFRYALKSKPWIIVCVLHFVVWVTHMFSYQNVVYYAKYCLGNEQLASLMLALPTVCMFALSFFVPAVTRRIGKLNCGTMGIAVSTAATLLIYFAGKNVVLVVLLGMLVGAGASFSLNINMLRCPDTIDHAEWLTGKRPQGLMTAMLMFMSKAGMAVAGVLSPMILNAGGYVANREQTAPGLLAIRLNYIWIPVVLGAVSIVISRFCRLDSQTISKYLAERHQQTA